MRVALALPWLTAVVLSSRSAPAHHVVSEHAVAPTLPTTSAELDLQAAAFDLGERSGSWQALATALEVAPVRVLSLRARVPLARVSYSDGAETEGVGDLELAAKVALVSAPAAEIAAGVGMEAPTGSGASGIGSGHFEIAPFALGSFTVVDAAPQRVQLVGLVSERLSLGGSEESHTHDPGATEHEHDAGVHGSVISPHADHEIATRLLAAYLRGAWSAAAGVEAIWILSPDAGIGPLVARAETGLRVAENGRATAGFDLPVAGERRFDWRLRAGFGWSF